jgi:hypothetical protein
MRHAVVVSAVLGALQALATAQGNTFTVPSKGTVWEPGSVWGDRSDQVFVLWGVMGGSSSAGSRVQYLYDVSDIPVATANVAAVQLRPPRDSGWVAATYTTSITLSVGPNGSTNASSQFANNHGAGFARVFAGTINVPSTASSPTWPAPWMPPIAFAQPFPYASVAGGSLVVDFETTASSSGQFAALEGYRLEGGLATFEHYDQDCMNSAGQTSGGFGWSPATLIPGGTFVVNVSGAPPATPSYAANAFLFGSTGRGSAWGPFVTPFPIRSLGLPSPAGCDLVVGNVFVGIAGTYRDSGMYASCNIDNLPIPNDPTLPGVVLFTQPVGIDMPNGSPTLLPLTTIRWTIGTGVMVPVSHVRSIFDPTGPPPSFGQVQRSEGASLRFAY